jgi:hypothetical protein
MLAAGDAELAVQPVSELLHVSGIDFVGPIPSEVQYVSVFSAAVVTGAKEVEASKRLISFLTSEKAAGASKPGWSPQRTTKCDAQFAGSRDALRSQRCERTPVLEAKPVNVERLGSIVGRTATMYDQGECDQG